MEQNLTHFCETFLKLKESEDALIVVTMTAARGSTPQDVGARMIVGKQGLLFGTIGGGKIEAHCLKLCKELIEQGKSKIESFKWNLQKDIGMTCGGEVQILFESFNKTSSWNIALFGAGHISQALTRLLLTLNCQLSVIDHRQDWLDKLPESKQLKKILLEDPKQYIAELPENTFVCLMTMGHASDTPILYKALSERKFPYLGVIGSLAKRKIMESELKERGLNTFDFICPMGEDFGTNSPSEIAISISAQLLKMRDQLF